MDGGNVQNIRKKGKSSQKFQITQANIKHLDDLTRGIQDKKSNQTSWFDDVNGIFSNCQQYHKRYSDCCQLQDHSFDFLQKSHVTRLIQLLKDSILSHRWTDAIKIVHTLVKEDHMAKIMWKAGIATLAMDKDKSVEHYTSHICHKSELPKVEILFEYLLHLLAEGNLNVVNGLNLDALQRCEPSNAEENYLRVIFHAYLGLVDYVCWKEETVHGDADDETDEDFISEMFQGHSRQHSQIKAEKAIQNFSYIRGIPGIWDIFIVKMVEIHEFYNELEAARSLLKEYQECNPDNLNAHRYMYMFAIKHEENNNELILQCLQNIVRLDPSNPLALVLHKELRPSHPKVSCILFDFLDFNHCKSNVKAWKLLNRHLLKAKRSKKKRCAVKRCWTPRMDWWPHSSLQIEDDNTEILAKLKRNVHRKLDKYFSPQNSKS